jgi:cell division septum initiation protein DivIVA
MPDVQGKLDEIITMVETAKGKALSGSSAVIDRAALLTALEEMRQLLPAEMSEARSLLRERLAVQESARVQADEMLADARAEADRELDTAREERIRMVSESEVVEEAERVAAEITAEARAQAIRMREQTDEYVDASLARFEQLLTTSLDTVVRGRERVAASRAEASDLARYEAVEETYDEPADETYPGAPAGEANGHTTEVDVSWDSAERAAAESPAAANG